MRSVRPGDACAAWAAWRRWLAGRTIRARLIAGLLALFTVASVGVGLLTTVALRNFQLTQLDQQVASAGESLSHALEHPGGLGGPGSGASPGAGSGAGSGAAGAIPCRGSSPRSAIAFGQASGTFAARLLRGQVSFACMVVSNGGITSLRPVHVTAADLSTLNGLPVNGPPSTAVLSGLGGYRLNAVAGSDGDVHIAGLPMSGVQATVRRLELIELTVLAAALILMGLAGTGWVRLSLRPLDRMAATATEVSELPLERGEVDLPHRVPEADARTEVGRLGAAFNQMLGHVAASLAKREASEARLRQFVADASHELRTPLAGIRGYTELALRTSGDLGQDLRNALGRVDSESARMSRLVDDLLLLARLDAGRPLAHEEVDLTRLTIDVTSDAQVAGPDHTWVLDLPDEPVTVTGDQHRLHQVLANLLTNARAHTPPDSTVTVRLAPASGPDGAAGAAGAELTITDDGPGIPADLQEHVWERFARGDSARSRKAGSTGLGLAIVQAVVTAHHGRLSLTSQPGRTTFRIWLPSGGA